MRYYILPKTSGVALTEGSRLEVHLLTGDPYADYPILHGEEDVAEGLLDFINRFSEENSLGDAVFEDIVSEDAPVLQGTFLPDTYFYKLPADFHTPEGWIRVIPWKCNDITKPDTYEDEESEKQYEAYCLRKAYSALDKELSKPIESQDEDLINESVGLIEDITGEKIMPTEEEVEEVVKGVLSKILETPEAFEASRPDLMETVREMDNKLNKQG